MLYLPQSSKLTDMMLRFHSKTKCILCQDVPPCPPKRIRSTLHTFTVSCPRRKRKLPMYWYAFMIHCFLILSICFRRLYAVDGKLEGDFHHPSDPVLLQRRRRQLGGRTCDTSLMGGRGPVYAIRSSQVKYATA